MTIARFIWLIVGLLLVTTPPPKAFTQKSDRLPGPTTDIERWRFFLPPAEFDHEYKGELTIKRVTPDELRMRCPGKYATGSLPVGCTNRFLDGASCVVYIAKDAFLYGVPYDIVLRHETGHCNNWRH